MTQPDVRKRGRANLDSSIPRPIVERALADYRRGQDTAKSIAARYLVDVKRLRRWADAAGYPRPPLGRRALSEPSALQQRLLQRMGSMRLTQLSARAGVSRQYLHALAKRWPGWVGRVGRPRQETAPAFTRQAQPRLRQPVRPLPPNARLVRAGVSAGS
jgi:hypothetical protein